MRYRWNTVTDSSPDIELYATVLALESYVDSGNYEGDGNWIYFGKCPRGLEGFKKKNVGLI